jgi:hypothetical protein
VEKGRGEHPALAEFGLRITRAQREYYNYRYDEASYQAELARLRSPQPRPARDFRSRKQREEEDGATMLIPVKAVDPAPR